MRWFGRPHIWIVTSLPFADLDNMARGTFEAPLVSASCHSCGLTSMITELGLPVEVLQQAAMDD